MRMRSAVAVLAGVAALAACSSDEGGREAAILEGVNGCVAGFEDSRRRDTNAMVTPGLDPRRLCDCLVRRSTEGLSGDEIRDRLKSRPPADQMSTCFAEEMDHLANQGGTR